MKLSVLQSNLRNALNTIGFSVGNDRTATLVTRNVLFETHQGMLRLTGANQESFCRTRLGAMVEEEGRTLLPYRLLRELVNTFPDERVDLTLQADDDQRNSQQQQLMDIRCGRSAIRLNVADPRNFPRYPKVKEASWLTLPAQTLADAVRLTAFSAARDESRPVLTGLCLEAANGTLTLASADGFRLSVYTTPLPPDAASADIDRIIIPYRTMEEVAKLAAANPRGDIRMAMPENAQQIAFRMENVQVVSNLIINGSFPDYSGLIPDEHQHRVVMDAGEFRDYVRRAGIFAKDGANIVRLVFDIDEAEPGATTGTISATSEEVGNIKQSFSPENMEGGQHQIAFNYRYLNEIAHVMPTKRLVLDTNATSQPGVFRPIADDDAAHQPEEGFIHVVMPMYVQW